MTATFQRPDIIRPPSEWRSYYLPLTAGCSNNTCTFCNFYGLKLQVRDKTEVKAEVDALASFINSGIITGGQPRIVYALAQEWDGQQIFLQDGDALVYPFDDLKEILAYINEKLPHVERIAAYGTAHDVLRLSVSQLEELRKLKLGILYIGLESGDDEALKRIDKRMTAAEIIKAAKRIKEAGILSSVTIILGLGGPEGSRRHVAATAKALTEMDPDYVGALTLSVIPGTPLYNDVKEGKFKLITPMESVKELLAIIRQTSFTKCFFSSMHASNYFSVRGTLPQDKDRMIKELEKVIASNDPALLRPEYLRGL
ncbi:MAG: radical SAM protein [Dehalococcoidales bacterium]|nr:radical SAM protein [Dehalococcoidales bacterium]